MTGKSHDLSEELDRRERDRAASQRSREKKRLLIEHLSAQLQKVQEENEELRKKIDTGGEPDSRGLHEKEKKYIEELKIKIATAGVKKEEFQEPLDSVLQLRTGNLSIVKGVVQKMVRALPSLDCLEIVLRVEAYWAALDEESLREGRPKSGAPYNADEVTLVTELLNLTHMDGEERVKCGEQVKVYADRIAAAAQALKRLKGLFCEVEAVFSTFLPNFVKVVDEMTQVTEHTDIRSVAHWFAWTHDRRDAFIALLSSDSDSARDPISGGRPPPSYAPVQQLFPVLSFPLAPFTAPNPSTNPFSKPHHPPHRRPTHTTTLSNKKARSSSGGPLGPASSNHVTFSFPVPLPFPHAATWPHTSNHPLEGLGHVARGNDHVNRGHHRQGLRAHAWPSLCAPPRPESESEPSWSVPVGPTRPGHVMVRAGPGLTPLDPGAGQSHVAPAVGASHVTLTAGTSHVTPTSGVGHVTPTAMAGHLASTAVVGHAGSSHVTHVKPTGVTHVSPTGVTHVSTTGVTHVSTTGVTHVSPTAPGSSHVVSHGPIFAYAPIAHASTVTHAPPGHVPGVTHASSSDAIGSAAASHPKTQTRAVPGASRRRLVGTALTQALTSRDEHAGSETSPSSVTSQTSLPLVEPMDAQPIPTAGSSDRTSEPESRGSRATVGGGVGVGVRDRDGKCADGHVTHHAAVRSVSVSSSGSSGEASSASSGDLAAVRTGPRHVIGHVTGSWDPSLHHMSTSGWTSPPTSDVTAHHSLPCDAVQWAAPKDHVTDLTLTSDHVTDLTSDHVAEPIFTGFTPRDIMMAWSPSTDLVSIDHWLSEIS